MMDHISWTEYLLSVLAAAAVYYLWVGLRFYRQEIATFFNIRKPNPAGGPVIPVSASVMGTVLEGPERLVDDTDLQFGEPEMDDLQHLEVRHLEDLGTNDLTEEVEALIEVIAETAEPKENFLTIFGLLAEKYAAVADAATKETIQTRLLDPQNGFAFQLRKEDLNELWYKTINQ